MTSERAITVIEIGIVHLYVILLPKVYNRPPGRHSFGVTGLPERKEHEHRSNQKACHRPQAD